MKRQLAALNIDPWIIELIDDENYQELGRQLQIALNRFGQARKAIRIYRKAMFLGDWFKISPASERRAIRAVLRLLPEVVPEGCHGYPELELERGRTH